MSQEKSKENVFECNDLLDYFKMSILQVLLSVLTWHLLYKGQG